ncbi:hypothetical protein U6G28_02625 [Actinomycetaceae bacterium MB13-C1-2]|nr:hypothetical protein U6G28_02625 [Actinomycetaceae bacterium MB13-C1-2]
MARVTAPDLELWLTTYLRTTLKLDGFDVQVSNKEPATLSLPLPKPLIVVRDDSGARLSHVTFDRSVGVSVLAGSKTNDKAANDLARVVQSILTDDAIVDIPGSPIAAVPWDGCNGPYAVADNLDVARRYSTVQYTVVGSW